MHSCSQVRRLATEPRKRRPDGRRSVRSRPRRRAGRRRTGTPTDRATGRATPQTPTHAESLMLRLLACFRSLPPASHRDPVYLYKYCRSQIARASITGTSFFLSCSRPSGRPPPPPSCGFSPHVCSSALRSPSACHPTPAATPIPAVAPAYAERRDHQCPPLGSPGEPTPPVPGVRSAPVRNRG